MQNRLTPANPDNFKWNRYSIESATQTSIDISDATSISYASTMKLAKVNNVVVPQLVTPSSITVGPCTFSRAGKSEGSRTTTTVNYYSYTTYLAWGHDLYIDTSGSTPTITGFTGGSGSIPITNSPEDTIEALSAAVGYYIRVDVGTSSHNYKYYKLNSTAYNVTSLHYTLTDVKLVSVTTESVTTYDKSLYSNGQGSDGYWYYGVPSGTDYSSVLLRGKYWQLNSDSSVIYFTPSTDRQTEKTSSTWTFSATTAKTVSEAKEEGTEGYDHEPDSWDGTYFWEFVSGTVSYKWWKYQATGSLNTSITLGSTLSYGNSVVLATSGDNIVPSIVSPTSVSVGYDTYSKYEVLNYGLMASASGHHVAAFPEQDVTAKFKYSSTIQIVSNEVQLVSPTTLEFAYSDSISSCDVLKGKYVVFDVNGAGTRYSPVNFVSQTAEFTLTDLGDYFLIQCDGGKALCGSSYTPFVSYPLPTPTTATSYDSSIYTQFEPGSETYLCYWYYKTSSGALDSTDYLGKYISNGTNIFYIPSTDTQTSSTSTWAFSASTQIGTSYTEVLETTPGAHTEGWDGTYYWKYIGIVVFSIGDDYLFGGISYKQVTNTETNLEVGTTSSAEISFTTTYTGFTKGNIYKYSVLQRNDGSTWRDIGKFVVYSVEKSNNKYKVKAYDLISKFDVVIDDWLDEEFPTLNTIKSLGTFFSDLCDECDVTAYSSTFTNSDYEFKRNFSGKNLRARTLLGYIASAAGGHIIADKDGKIKVCTYPSTFTTLTASQYISAEIAEYDAPVIDQVKIAQDPDTTSTWHYYPETVGTYNAVMWINTNPILVDYTGKPDGDKKLSDYTYQSGGSTITVEGVAHAIYTNVHAYSYTPMTVELYEDYSINAGDRIKIGDKYAYIFSKEMSSSGVTLTATSEPTREAAATTASSEIIALRNQVHTIENTEASHYEELSETTAEISSDLTTVTNRVTTVEATASGLTTRVSAAETNITTVDGKVDDLDAETTQHFTEVEQTADALEVRVGTAEDTLDTSLTINSSGILMYNEGGTVTVAKGGINLTGAITFDDLNSSVKSTIYNGNAIRQTTVPTVGPDGTSALTSGQLWFINGTPSGNAWAANHSYAINTLVYVTGTVIEYYICNTAHTSGTEFVNTYWTQIKNESWLAYNGSTWDLVSNPTYISSTYIDSTEVRSPKIVGENILVNATNGGAFKVQTNGSTVGLMGAGSWYGTDRVAHPGVMVACDTDPSSIEEETGYFMAATTSDIRLQAADMVLYLDSNGAHVNLAGTVIDLGYARFA